jgi:hypothetical protein
MPPLRPLPPSMTVTPPAAFAVSQPLSDLPPAPSTGSVAKKIHPLHPLPHQGALADSTASSIVTDDALQTHLGPHLNHKKGAKFPGVGANGYYPGDPNIAVGPNHIVQTVNVQIGIYDKSGNLLAGYPKTLGSLWTALGGACTSNSGDPIAQYDKLADRFVITQLGSLSAPYVECIAVSKTNDPTGAYYLYSYNFGTNLNDYDKFGVWPTATNGAYLATYNLFASGAFFAGADLCAYDRTAMLTGAPANQICFTVGNGGFLPSDLDGSTAPPDGAPGYFLAFDTFSTVQLYKLSPNFANPGSSTLTGGGEIGVAPFSEACGGGICVPQSGTSQTLDSLGDRLMYRLAYRNFGDHEAIVVNHSVDAGSSVGVRWYELRQTPTSAFSLFQQGTFAPDSTYRWMGSAAMDSAGDIALGYSASSSTLFPSIRYTARVPSDSLGTMEAESVLQPGGGSQTGASRWGDYSALRIDPSDDCTFWYTNEYYPVSSSIGWATAIGSFKLSNCAKTPDFSITESSSLLKFTQGTGGTSNGTATVTWLNGLTNAVTLTAGGACGANAITCTLGTSPLTPSIPSSSLKIGLGTTTPAGSYPITVTGTTTTPTLTHSTTLTVVVSAPVADFTISASPSSLTVRRKSSGTYTVTLGAVGGVSSSVTLSVCGLPSKTSASFSGNPVTTPATGTVSPTITTRPSPSATPGTYNLTITGTNGNFTHSAPVTLVIQ